MAGRILRRSDGGRWPNCTVLPTPWPGIYGVAIDTKWEVVSMTFAVFGVSPYTFALVVIVVVVACHSLRNCRASRRSALASKDRMYTRQWSHLTRGPYRRLSSGLVETRTDSHSTTHTKDKLTKLSRKLLVFSIPPSHTLEEYN